MYHQTLSKQKQLKKPHTATLRSQNLWIFAAAAEETRHICREACPSLHFRVQDQSAKRSESFLSRPQSIPGTGYQVTHSAKEYLPLKAYARTLHHNFSARQWIRFCSLGSCTELNNHHRGLEQKALIKVVNCKQEKYLLYPVLHFFRVIPDQNCIYPCNFH